MPLQLYVGRSHLLVDKSALEPTLQAHLAYMHSLESDGVLFASGPFLDHGQITGEGLTIVRASSRAQARALFDHDPFVVAGLRRFEISEWQVREGDHKGAAS